MSSKLTLDQACTYRIIVQGRLDKKWYEYFDGMEILEDVDAQGYAVSSLTGGLTDQSAVLGLLQKLYNLGFPLISLEIIKC